MQRFSCPFCGERDETEFHFGVEVGKPRPEPSESVTAAAWSHYLYAQNAPQGEADEIWVHLTCGEFFIMRRNTVTREVIHTQPLPSRTT